MDLPIEFLTLTEALTLGAMGAVVFLIVQATKELKYIKTIATILWAWIVAFVLLLAGSIIQAGLAITAELVYLAVINSIVAAAVAVGVHQLAKKANIVQ